MGEGRGWDVQGQRGPGTANLIVRTSFHFNKTHQTPTVFFFAKSPEAPRTTMVVLSLSSRLKVVGISWVAAIVSEDQLASVWASRKMFTAVGGVTARRKRGTASDQSRRRRRTQQQSERTVKSKGPRQSLGEEVGDEKTYSDIAELSLPDI